MSVLKNKRSQSKAQFINVANEIFDETLSILTNLSKKKSRLLSDRIIECASKVIDNCEEGNSIFPSDNVRKNLREQHFLEARASLMALDVHMLRVYNILSSNPQGSLTNSKGDIVDPKKALEKLDKMAESLGGKIETLNGMLTKILRSDNLR